MYATPQQMIDRFGFPEMVRLSRPEDRSAEEVDEVKIATALADATSTIDGYLRGRYAVPLAAPPVDVVRAACHLARYDLADTGRSEPTDHMVEVRKEIMSWLKQIGNETVRIDAPRSGGETSNTGGMRVSDREPAFTNQSVKGL